MGRLVLAERAVQWDADEADVGFWCVWMAESEQLVVTPGFGLVLTSRATMAARGTVTAYDLAESWRRGASWPG